MAKPPKLEEGESNSKTATESFPTATLDCFAPNPRNPRRSSYSTLMELADSMSKVGQLQNVVAVSIDKWIDRFPEDAEKLPMDAEMVTLMGSSRLKAAPFAGLDVLHYVLRDDLMDHELGPIVAAALENLDREDFTRMDLARLCQDIAIELGPEATDTQVAERLGKKRTWATQHLGLLRLVQPIQDMVDQRTDTRLSFTVMREVASVAPEKQLEHLRTEYGIVPGEPGEESSVADLVNPTKSVTAVTPRRRGKKSADDGGDEQRGIQVGTMQKYLDGYLRPHKHDAQQRARFTAELVVATLDEDELIATIGHLVMDMGPQSIELAIGKLREAHAKVSPTAERSIPSQGEPVEVTA